MKTRVFNKAITDCYCLVRVTPADNTWKNVKRCFCLLGEVQFADTPFNQAIFVCQVVDAIQESPANNDSQQSNEDVSDPSGNAMHANSCNDVNPSNSTLDPNLSALFHQMMTMNTNLKSALNNSNHGSGNSNLNGNGNCTYNNRRNNCQQCHTVTMRYFGPVDGALMMVNIVVIGKVDIMQKLQLTIVCTAILMVWHLDMNEK